MSKKSITVDKGEQMRFEKAQSLQIIDPATKSVDTTVVAGIRVKMDL